MRIYIYTYVVHHALEFGVRMFKASEYTSPYIMIDMHAASKCSATPIP